MFYRYNFDTDVWSNVTPVSSNNPDSRYGHSLAEYQVNI